MQQNKSQIESTNAPLLVVSADAHAAASLATYRDYIDPRYHAELDLLALYARVSGAAIARTFADDA